MWEESGAEEGKIIRSEEVGKESLEIIVDG